MKKITRWIELIFIFGIPLLLLILCMQFKTINIYDENNNIITSEKVLDIKELDFISTDEKTYWSYIYYELDEVIQISVGDVIYFNSNKSPLIVYRDSLSNEYEYIFYEYNNTTYHIQPLFEQVNVSSYNTIDYLDDSTVILRSGNDITLLNKYGNIIKSIETKTITENAISKVLNIMYDSLGINNNIIIQLIVIYTLLWIIMFIIWHIFYLPFNKLLHLFEKE